MMVLVFFKKKKLEFCPCKRKIIILMAASKIPKNGEFYSRDLD